MSRTSLKHALEVTGMLEEVAKLMTSRSSQLCMRVCGRKYFLKVWKNFCLIWKSFHRRFLHVIDPQPRTIPFYSQSHPSASSAPSIIHFQKKKKEKKFSLTQLSIQGESLPWNLIQCPRNAFMSAPERSLRFNQITSARFDSPADVFLFGELHRNALGREKLNSQTNKFSSFSFIPKNHVPLLSKRAFQYFIEASCYSEISPFSSINCATKREFEAFCWWMKSIYEGDVLAREKPRCRSNHGRLILLNFLPFELRHVRSTKFRSVPCILRMEWNVTFQWFFAEGFKVGTRIYQRWS